VDVLKRSPGVTIDKDGGIILKGKTGVLVMLDDKPLYMTAEQVGNLLKAIPSDQIKEIEIITSPSAKYDAAGTAGIINIKLKKGAYEGFNGTATISYGQGVYHKTNAGVNVSYKKKKISLGGGYQYNNKINLFNQNSSRVYNDPSSSLSQLHADQHYRSPQETHSITFNSGYDLSDKTSVSLDFIGSYNEYGWDGATHATSYAQDNSVQSSYASTDYGAYIENNYNTNVGIKHKLDTNGTVISGSVNYTRFKGVSNKRFETQNFDSLYQNDGNPFLYIFRDPSHSNQYSVKVDFSGKLFKTIKLEAGGKLIHTDKSNPADITITQNHLASDASNPFNYQEGIYAAYTTLNRKLGEKWKAQIGVRMEHTDIKGVQTSRDTSFTRNYTNLFPSGNLTFNSSNKTSYSLLYSRRITRPTSWQLNPVLAIIDPYSSWGGNPYLLPEYTDNMELSQSLFSGYVVTTINYSYTKQPIAWGLTVDSVTLKSITQPHNLQYKQNMGISVAVNMPITKWWTTSVYAYGYRNRVVGDLGYGSTDKSQLALTLTSTQTFTLSKKTSAEISGNYESPWVYGLNSISARGQFNMAIQRKIWANKATVKLAVTDLFWSDQWTTNSTLGTINAYSSQKWDNRVVMLTFSYRFGNIVNRL
ncbi:MAG: putative TonB-dependent receptor, partial [Chitinophagaceae bacterium]|nr:putative TonB-dependent receptor [Chitinophagaceae bacterium]